jgi:hypothetical protein
MKTKFVTYYYDIDDTNYYEKKSENLKNSLNSLGAELKTYNPEFENNYNINCLRKPEVIIQAIDELNEDIIWIDADCYIQNLPIEMDNQEEDIGIVIRNHDMETPHVALIYFKNNKKTKSFLDDWNKKCVSKIKEVKEGKYDGGDHDPFIDTFKDRTDVSYKLYSPMVASTNIPTSSVLIGISPGGLGVEQRKVIHD